MTGYNLPAMLTVLVLIVLGSLATSFFCSISEAALYAVPYAYVKHLADTGSRPGKILLAFKEDMSRPIAAILIVNTLANTTGPALATSMVDTIFGPTGVIVGAIVLTLSVLYLGEIAPKIVGVAYAKSISRGVAIPISYLITLFSPFISITRHFSERIEPVTDEPSVSHEEVLSMAAIGTEEGELDHFEGSVITNVLGLDKLLLRDVLTPRVVVFRQEESRTLSELEREIPSWTHSRIPLFVESDPDHLVSYVIQRDIYRELIMGNREIQLKDLSLPLETVPALMRVDQLLLRMFENKQHICAVVDEHGGLAGIVTLEDLIEEIVGREIVDEHDQVADLRQFARVLRMVRSRKKSSGGV